MSSILACTMLIFIRLMPILVVAPVMAFRRIPGVARIVLALACAAVMAGAIAQQPVHSPGWSDLAEEFFLGVSMAFGFHAAVGSVHAMGNMIEQQMGLAAAAVFDPGTEQSNGLVAELLTVATVFGFLAFDGHHALLRGFSTLLTVVPPGTSSISTESTIGAMGQQFALAFSMLAPTVLSIWVLDFALALVSRAAPQANVYFVAIPVKLVVGMLSLALTCKAIGPSLRGMVEAAATPMGV